MGPLGVFAFLYLLFEKKETKKILKGGTPLNPNFSFLSARKKEVKKASTPSKSSPILEDLKNFSQRPTKNFMFWYRGTTR